MRKKLKILIFIMIMLLLLLILIVNQRNFIIQKISTTANNYDVPEMELTYFITSTNENDMDIVVTATSTEAINKIITPDGNEISIQGNRTKVAVDYKIVSGQQYIFKIQTNSSEEFEEYILKEDENSKPAINQNTSYEYPLITPTEVTINKEITIDYGDKTDNYYSTDKGITWQQYNNAIKISNNCVLWAKSKSDEKKIQKISEEKITINIAGNALPPICYDNKSSTSVRSNSTYYAKVSNEMWGRQINCKGYFEQHAWNYGQVRIEQLPEDINSSTLATNYTTDGNGSDNRGYNKNITIVQNAVWLRISLWEVHSFNNSECKSWLYDIWPVQ